MFVTCIEIKTYLFGGTRTTLKINTGKNLNKWYHHEHTDFKIQHLPPLSLPLLPLHSISSPSTFLPSLVLLEQSARARVRERERNSEKERKTGDRLSKEKRARKKKPREERVGRRERWRWGERRGRGDRKIGSGRTKTRERERARASETEKR